MGESDRQYGRRVAYAPSQYRGRGADNGDPLCPRAAAEFPRPFDGKEFPAKALASLGDAAGQSRIFTSDQWGDFVIYNLYPKSRYLSMAAAISTARKFREKYLDIVTCEI